MRKLETRIDCKVNIFFKQRYHYYKRYNYYLSVQSRIGEHCTDILACKANHKAIMGQIICLYVFFMIEHHGERTLPPETFREVMSFLLTSNQVYVYIPINAFWSVHKKTLRISIDFLSQTHGQKAAFFGMYISLVWTC